MSLKILPPTRREDGKTHRVLYWRKRSEIAIGLEVLIYLWISGGLYWEATHFVNHSLMVGYFLMASFAVRLSFALQAPDVFLGEFDIHRTAVVRKIIEYTTINTTIRLIVVALIIAFFFFRTGDDYKLITVELIMFSYGLSLVFRALRFRACLGLAAQSP